MDSWIDKSDKFGQVLRWKRGSKIQKHISACSTLTRGGAFAMDGDEGDALSRAPPRGCDQHECQWWYLVEDRV